MNSNRCANPTKWMSFPSALPNTTFTVSSKSFDKPKLFHHSTPSRRHLTFHSDSEEEFSDTSLFDESRIPLELLKSRLFLYELSPRRSKLILKSAVYQKLVQLTDLITFLIALILLISFELLKQLFTYLHERRGLLYDWGRKWIPYASLGVITCGFCSVNFVRGINRK